MTLPLFFEQAGLEIVKMESSGVRLPKDRSNVMGKLKKSYLSTLSRVTLKGDRIIVLEWKPL